MSNILIVDNDPSVCSVTRASLRKTPHRLCCAHDVASALEIANQEWFAMALVDVETVNGNMQEFLLKLRQAQGSDEGVVILTSSIGKALGMDLAIKVGAAAFFGKPFSPIKLRNFIIHTLAMEQHVSVRKRELLS